MRFVGVADAFQQRHRWVGMPLAVVYKYADDQGGFLAALITYYAFLSLFPALLLGFLLLMGRVEEPLNRSAPERELEQFLDDANPDELATFVREGTDSALRRFRQRLNPRRLLRSSTWRRAAN